MTEEKFFRWTSQNFYRTSYNDMRNRSPVENKNHALPGYKGFVPGASTGFDVGKRYTEATRRSLSRELDEKNNTNYIFATTGFNFTKIPKNDPTLEATSGKYGR